MPDGPVEHVDIVIVGAGLSGVGAACHLRSKCPSKRVAILEARDAIGGTWDLFCYPGCVPTPTCRRSGMRFARGATRKNNARDLLAFRFGAIEDGALEFRPRDAAQTAA